MKKIKNITFLLLFSSVVVFSQTKETKKADAFFNRLAYVKAAELFENLAEKNPTAYILKRLGDSYYFNVNMEKASNVYEKLFANFPNQVEAEYMFKYAQSLRGIGNYDLSSFWMEKFNKTKKSDSRGNNFVENKATLEDLQNGNDYKVENLKNINSKYSDFGVTFFNDKILFSSIRELQKFVKIRHTWNERSFLDIYQVSKDSIHIPNQKTNFSKNINLKYHESSVAFSPDKKTIYFTRNNFNEGVYKKDKKGINRQKIYKGELINGEWENIKELPFCSDEYSVGHPTVSKDGKRLYFTSDMPGSIGKTDIYTTIINDDGTFGVVENLGNKINTEGREMFPFIAEDNTLYFASDGHFGLGGLDVFSSKIKEGVYQEPENLKAPINSNLDDFAFVINPSTKKGYLSSNRKGGVGDDDIYSVIELEKPIPVKPCLQVVTGIVRDKKFQKPLSGSRIILKNELGEVLKDTIVGALGRFTFTLPCNEKYQVFASKEYYKSDQDSFNTTKAAKIDLNLDFNLEIADDFMYNNRNELIVRIKPIYFDYNKANIRSDAVLELEKVIRVIKKYPKIVIRSSSHTDARGRDSYNEALSDRRAKSTVFYIISKGVNPNRITGKGFGETQLTNGCVDNNKHTNKVKCSKEEHQANRRTEFVIIKM